MSINPIFTERLRLNRPILCGQYKKEACKG